MKGYMPLLAACLSATSLSVFADEIGYCKKIYWNPDRVYPVKAAMNRATHVILPEDMVGNPITGNQDLWVVEGQRTHLFVKPTSEAEEGRETTVSIIGQSNTSYEFLFRRVNERPDVCVRIIHQGGLIQGDTISSYRTQEEKTNSIMQKRVSALEDEVQQERKKASEQAKKAAEDALQKYRSHIYTRYGWSQGMGFLGKNAVSDIWDDGRFTYIRLNTDNKGLLTVTAKVDGKEEYIEYKYDSDAKIYKIAGIYPEFKLMYGKSNITVKREDNVTTGGY